MHAKGLNTKQRAKAQCRKAHFAIAFHRFFVVRRLIFFSLIFCLVFFSCEKNPLPTEKNKIVAEVATIPITQHDLIKYYATIIPPTGPDSDQEKPVPFTLKKLLLEKLIEKELVLHVAVREGIRVTDEEVNNMYEKVAKDYGKNFTAFLAKLKIKPGKWKAALREDLIIQKVYRRHLQDVTPPNSKTIRAFYMTHQNAFRLPMQYRFSQIVVPALKMAEEIRKKLENGVDFSKLAREYSISSEGRNGGDLGYWREDRLPKEFTIVKQMKVGEVSDIIHTAYGYHLIMLKDVKDARQLSLNEATPRIVARLMQEKREAEKVRWLKELWDKSHIVIYKKALKETRFRSITKKGSGKKEEITTPNKN